MILTPSLRATLRYEAIESSETKTEGIDNQNLENLSNQEIQSRKNLPFYKTDIFYIFLKATGLTLILILRKKTLELTWFNVYKTFILPFIESFGVFFLSYKANEPIAHKFLLSPSLYLAWLLLLSAISSFVTFFLVKNKELKGLSSQIVINNKKPTANPKLIYIFLMFLLPFFNIVVIMIYSFILNLLGLIFNYLHDYFTKDVKTKTLA